MRGINQSVLMSDYFRSHLGVWIGLPEPLRQRKLDDMHPHSAHSVVMRQSTTSLFHLILPTLTTMPPPTALSTPPSRTPPRTSQAPTTLPNSKGLHPRLVRLPPNPLRTRSSLTARTTLFMSIQKVARFSHLRTAMLGLGFPARGRR